MDAGRLPQRDGTVRPLEGGGDIAHELVHLLADQRIGLHAEIEIEEDLFDPHRLHRLEPVDDLLRRTQQDRVFVEILDLRVGQLLPQLRVILHRRRQLPGTAL